MLNFIICDDNKYFNQQVVKIVEKFIFQNKLKAKIYTFFDFTDEMKSLIYDNSIGFKIYILDIQLPKIEGYKIAELIRYKANDITSYIIFITTFFEEYEKFILKGKYSFLDYINKIEDYKTQLLDNLEYGVRQVKKKNIIILKTRDMTYRIAIEDILYIYYDKSDRQSHVVTSLNYTALTYKLLSDLIRDDLDDTFDYCSRSCLINKDRISYIDNKNLIIHFKDTDATCDLVSKQYIKKLL